MDDGRRTMDHGPRTADAPKGPSMPKSKPKTIPKFEDEDEERAFWADHDSTDYVDWSHAKRVALPKLKPSTKLS